MLKFYVPFLSQLSYVQVLSMIFLQCVCVCVCQSQGAKAGRGGKSQKTDRKERGRERTSKWNEEATVLRTEEEKMHQEVADEKCFRGRQTFFG